MANVAQRAFSAGELSPAMYARTDLERYATGLRTLRNAVVLRTGGVQSRPGTEYLGSTKDDGEARLVSAVFDTTANYVLEFGEEYVRFWKDGELTQPGTSAGWSGSSVVYTAGTTVTNGSPASVYICLANHTSGASTEPGVGASWETVWYSLGLSTGSVVELPTPYSAADVAEMQFATQQDVLTIVHPDHPPATLSRIVNPLASGESTWVYDTIDFAATVPLPENVAVSGSSGSGWGYAVAALYGSSAANPTDGGISAVSGYVRTNNTDVNLLSYASTLAGSPRTITWNAVANPGNHTVQYVIYLTQSASQGEAYAYYTPPNVTSFVDNGSVWAANLYFLSSPTVAPSVFAAAGKYPAVVGAYQQRLLFGGAEDTPDVVQASQVASPYNFAVSNPLVDSDSMSWRQVGRRLNRVRHFVEAAQRLFQFSDIGESIVQGDTDGILRPGEVNPRQFSENGAAIRPAPLVVNDTALYVQARGSMVRDLAPMQVGGFAGSDLTLQAAHLVDGYELVDWCYQQTPHSVVWAVREDGQLLSLTYVRELGILGWAHHDTLGEIESVCCVPEGTLDAVYVVVKRTIDSNVVRYVERFTNRLADAPVLMDASVTAV
jgi:hypothetical protein